MGKRLSQNHMIIAEIDHYTNMIGVKKLPAGKIREIILADRGEAVGVRMINSVRRSDAYRSERILLKLGHEDTVRDRQAKARKE